MNIEIIPIEDPDGRFVEDHWIQQGKKYCSQALPTFVTNAKDEAFKIPAESIVENLLPSPALSVNMLLTFSLPRVSSELISTKPKSWFSTDTPTTDLNVLKSRSIPSGNFISRLQKISGQEWMDGAKSIIDPRFNDGADRLPLWVLSFWDNAINCDKIQLLWKNSTMWLEREESRFEDEPSKDIFQKVYNSLGSLPWNVPMKYLMRLTQTSQLSHFLGTRWLSDDHINMMIFELRQDLEDISENPKAAIADLTFSNELCNVNLKLVLSSTHRERTALYKWEVAIREKGIEKIFFPLHINGNHWIAGSVDFKHREIVFGDSLKRSSEGFGAPAKFVTHLQMWLKHGFGGKRFTNHGNNMPHSTQDDSHSCPIITLNTIAHGVFLRPLWESGSKATSERLEWFLRLAGSYQITQSPNNGLHTTTSSSFLENLLNPTVTFNETPIAHNSSEGPSHFTPTVTSIFDTNSDSSTYDSDEPSESDQLGDSDSKSMGDDSDSDPTGGSDSESKSDGAKESVPKFTQSKLHTFFKRAHSQSLDSDSRGNKPNTANQSSKKPIKASTSSSKPPKKRIRIGDGMSKSAVASRELRTAAKQQGFKPDLKRYEAWQAKVRAVDPQAEFDPYNCTRARHSLCGQFVAVREPYDFSRFHKHVVDCIEESEEKGTTLTAPSLFDLAWGTRKVSNPEASLLDPPSNIDVDEEHTTSRREVQPMLPCPGITEADHANVVKYLKRTSVQGGGARSLAAIAKKIFKKTFSALKNEKNKKKVADIQQHEQTWRNDHANLRVYSNSCEKMVVDRSSFHQRPKPCKPCVDVLQSKAFRNATRRPVPPTKNYIYVNKRFRNSVVGEIYASNIGVKELVEDEDARDSPFVRYALGAVKGDYDNKVFNGLLQAMVTKHDKEERNVGLQNFSYAPAWEEMCHILRIHSSRAYKSLREYLPMPSERNLRKQEARQPRFPMDICNRTFDLVAQHLKTLSFDGPVALSCDDTKLFATFRLYWDSAQSSYFLVGGTAGPIRVADPESVGEAIRQAKIDKNQEKATKVRVYCVTTSAPGVTPIIAAAIPITSLDAPALLILLKKMLDGLIDKGISIVSYACDGTEVERNVQRLFLEETVKTSYTIPNPRPGCNPTIITYGTYRSQVICMIQDSKHALKTMRNNLFSGARLLTFGNFVACYQHIAQIKGDGSPLYNRDTTKIDRQDDNAAVRLFSAAVLQYLADHHRDNIGEVVYLFVFGELIDAYQNRSIPHLERIKLALCARYFLDSWELYLNLCGYRKDRYFISREANDILRIIIEGLIALVIIHRDHVPGQTALLPWLHSSEACEHVFGEARFVVKDFTYLDFIYMIPKLRIKLHEAVLRGKSGNGKARAAGYSHTYFDNEGLDLAVLSTFPSDAEIQDIATSAMQEANSLIALLGVDAGLLHRQRQHGRPSGARSIWLPSIPSWFDEESDDLEAEGNTAELDIGQEYDSDNSESGICEAEQLQLLLDNEEYSPISRSEKLDKKCLNLTSAAVAILAEESAHVRQFASVEDDELDELISAEYIKTQKTIAFLDALPPVRLPDNRSLPLGHGSVRYNDLDFAALIAMRRRHQTKHAELGVRTQGSKKSSPDSESDQDSDTESTTKKKKELTIRGRIIRKFHEALREAQDEQGINTGRERNVRWTESEREPAPGGRGGIIAGVGTVEPSGGNSANAAAAAAAVAQQAAKTRKTLFVKCKVPNAVELIDARVSIHRPIQIGDCGFVYTENGIMIGKVVTLYSKTGGKNGKHAAVTESSIISALSYMGIQLFQCAVGGQQFGPITDATAIFRTNEYHMLPSLHFLCLITSKITFTHSVAFIELSAPDLDRYRALRDGVGCIAAAMKLSRKRGGKNSLPSED